MKVKDINEIIDGYNPVGWDKSNLGFVHCSDSYLFHLKMVLLKVQIRLFITPLTVHGLAVRVLVVTIEFKYIVVIFLHLHVNLIYKLSIRNMHFFFQLQATYLQICKILWQLHFNPVYYIENLYTKSCLTLFINLQTISEQGALYNVI